MAWASTPVDAYWVGNPGMGHPRLVTVTECVYSGTGYGGGLSITGATAATGPTKSDLGFTGTTDGTFNVIVQQIPQGVTGAVYFAATRQAFYDVANQRLVVGATAATDISDTTYRLRAVGKYGP